MRIIILSVVCWACAIGIYAQESWSLRQCIDYATAQLVARRDNKIYLMQVDGVRTDICVGGKLMRNVKPRGTEKPVCKNIYLIDQATAQRMELGRLGDWSFGYTICLQR